MKRLSGIIVLLMLVLLFAVSARAATSTYDPNDTGGAGWMGAETTDLAAPPNALTFDAEIATYTSGQLDTISTAASSVQSANGAYTGHRIRFQISEAEGDVTQLDISSDGSEVGPAAGIFKLFIWNFDTTTWTLLDTSASGSQETLTGTISASITSYIDASGYVYGLQQADHGSASYGNNLHQMQLTVTYPDPPTEVTRYVIEGATNNGDGTADSEAASGGAAGAYNSFANFISGERADLVSANTNITVYMRGKAGSYRDTDVANFTSPTGWTTDATHGVTVICDPNTAGGGHSGYWDESSEDFYILTGKLSLGAGMNHFTMQGCAIDSTVTGTTNANSVYINPNGTFRYEFKDVLFNKTGDSTNGGEATYIGDQGTGFGGEYYLTNTISMGDRNGDDHRIHMKDGQTAYIRHNTVVSAGSGGYYLRTNASAGSLVVENNIGCNATSNDYQYTGTPASSTYNANLSCDTTANGTGANEIDSATLVFEDEATNNYQLADADSSGADNGGVDATSAVPEDIVGTTRDSSPTIGAWEGEAAPADVTAPTISTTRPLDNQEAVGITSNIVLTFSEAVDAETGNIYLYEFDDTLVETFDVTTDITGSGTATITINPTADLERDTSYYIQIDATAFDDAAGNSFAGIADETTLSFSAEPSNYFNWDCESTSSSTETYVGVLGAGTSISSEDAYAGTNACKFVADGNDGGNQAEGFEFTEHSVGSLMDGKTIYYRWYMKIDSAFSFGAGTAKWKAQRTKDSAQVITPPMTGYIQDDSIYIGECPGCDPAGDPASVPHDFTAEVGSGWHEYIAAVTYQSGVSTCDGGFEFFRDGVSIGSDSNICYVGATWDGEIANEAWAAWMVRPYFQLGGVEADGGTIYVDEVSVDSTWNSIYVDATAPTVSTLSPADDATGVAVGANLVITFDEAVDAESGNITLYKFDDTQIETFDVTTDISGTGTTTITINPASDLDAGTAYYVQIDASAFDDAAGNSFAGISDETTWSFVTALVDTTATYYPNTTDSNAWKVDNFGGGVKPPTTLACDTETAYSGTEITNTSTDNTSYATYGAPFSGHKVLHTLAQDEDDVTQLAFRVKAYSNGMDGGGEVTLFIWNFNTSAWVDTNQDTSAASIVALDHSISSNIPDYINDSGLVYYMIQSDRSNYTHEVRNYFSRLIVSYPQLDTTAPTVDTFSPADNATAVAVDANLVLTFDEPVRAQSGNIYLKKTSDDSTVETFDVTVDITGDETDTITLNPASDLDENTEYYIQIDATAFDDNVGNSYAGIADTTSWSFTTVDATAPTVQTLSPADNATGVSIDSNLVITFSEAVDAETGNITLKKSSDDSTVQTFDVTADISGSGTNTITLNPTADLDYSTGYYVQIDATAFDDAAGNSYGGIADTTTWNFTSEAEAAEVSAEEIEFISPGARFF